MSYRVTYINHLAVPLTVGWRSGLKFTLPPQPSMFNQNLIIRVEIRVSHSVKIDMQRTLSVVGEESTAELKALREALALQMKGPSYGDATFTLDYPLSLEDLQNYGGTVYYNELDCLISLLALDQAPPHPYSVAGRNQQLIETSALGQDGCGFGYSIDLVDSAGRYGDRYINIGGKIYRIPAVSDPTRRDGIYVISNAPVQGALGGDKPVVKHYPFEGADSTLGLYRTAEEAEQLGDASLARKLELAELEHQLIVNKRELLDAKHTHERELLDKDRELKQLQRQRELDALELQRVREREELERQRVKDLYEDRSYRRKDSSEALKFIPSIVVGIGAVLLALKAFF